MGEEDAPEEEPLIRMPTEREDPLRSSFVNLFVIEADRQGVTIQDLVEGYQVSSIGNILEDCPKAKLWQRARKAFLKWRQDHLGVLKTRAQTLRSNASPSDSEDSSDGEESSGAKLRTSFRTLYVRQATLQGVEVRDLVESRKICAEGSTRHPKAKLWMRAQNAFRKWHQDHSRELKARSRRE